MDILIQITAMVFLLSSMLGMGLSTRFRLVIEPLRDWRAVLAALGVNFVLAPGLAWAITAAIPMDRAYATGLLLLGGAAGAPFLPKLVAAARGDQAFGAALMCLLTLGTIGFMPFALPRIIPGFDANPWTVAKPLVFMVAVPMVIGMFFNGRAPLASARALPVIEKVSTAGLLLLLALLVASDFRGLVGVVGTGAIAVAILFTFLVSAAGYLLGGTEPRRRSVRALGAGARNIGAAFVAAAQNFPDRKVSIMVLVTAIVSVVLGFAGARWLRQNNSSTVGCL